MRRQRSSTNDNVPDKDKYLAANWRNMCITSAYASFAGSLKLLLRGLKISLNCSHLYWGFRITKATDEKISQMKTQNKFSLFWGFFLILFYRKNFCFTREREKGEIPLRKDEEFELKIIFALSTCFYF